MLIPVEVFGTLRVWALRIKGGQMEGDFFHSCANARVFCPEERELFPSACLYSGQLLLAS